ncbi:MAG: acetate/propionate family kinase [Gammaproteobacteria bacterium]|nr:acetate/propionate family kinase [Gammaproteobacteria bacterium]
MRILVINSGSATLKFQLFEINSVELQSVARGSIEARGNYAQATLNAFAQLSRLAGETWAESLNAVGHRIVHGGERFVTPTRITPQVLREIESLSALAPLHNPPALEVIRAARDKLGGGVPMYAVFDTAFYHDLPEAAKHYALPAAWTQRFHIRRYGFHGIAHRYLYERYAELSGKQAGRIITLQLGQGCSMSALHDGRPVDTSMGYTPLEGLIMATRPGDVDAGALLHLLRSGISMDELDQGLNTRSGLLGLSEISGDMRELLKLEAQGHSGAAPAVRAFCLRARKYLGAYLALLGGADAILFGGGIGEHAPQIRTRILSGMEWCGIALDEAANESALGVERRIGAQNSATDIYVIPVNEELLIAREVRDHLAASGVAIS